MVDGAEVTGGLVAAGGRGGLNDDALFGRHCEICMAGETVREVIWKVGVMG
jgi:hypothetical protein